MNKSTPPEVCRRRFVVVAGALLGGLAGELAYVAVRAVGSPWVASGIVALAAGLGISLLFVRKGGTGVGAPIHCGGLAVFAALALLCVVQTARAGGFMLRPEMPGWSLLPSNSFLVHHNCFTAYYEAARLVDQDPNVYDPVMYRPPPGPPGRAPAPGHTLDGFNVDHFEYPPTFLLLPRAAILAGASFLQARAEWFVFQTAAVILALLMVAWHLGGPAGWRFGSLAPLIYLAVAQQVALQISNFQPAAIALTMIALVTIARGRQVLGASVLSFVVLTKLFPGIVLVLFAARRQWRALLLTGAAMAAWIGLGAIILGVAPFEAFWRYQVPRIVSGAAFPMLNVPIVAAVNQSIYGIPLKLRFFGIGGGSFHAGSVLAWIYSVVPCAVAVGLGTRLGVTAPASEDWRQRETLSWALVIALATYRSPFLPQEYGAIGAIWVLGLLVAGGPLTRRRVAVFAVLGLLVELYTPWRAGDSPTVMSVMVAVAQLAAAAVLVVATRRGLRSPERRLSVQGLPAASAG